MGAVQGMSRVSILMPVFNGERFLEEQLRSIAGQSHDDFELLIYDDGSSDNSWSIIETFAAKDTRVRAVRSPDNDGQGYALSRLFEQSKSEWILFADQDDIWEANKVRELVRAAGGGHSLAYGLSTLVGEKGAALGQSIFDLVGPPITGEDRLDLMFVNTISGHASLVDRKVLDPIIFRLDGNYDRIAALAASLVNGITYTPLSITYHRLHGDNQVNQHLRGKGKPPRATRGEQLLRLWQTLRCLCGIPAINAQRRRILREMGQIVQSKLTETRSLYYTNGAFRQSMAGLARELTDDAAVLSVFERKIRRLSRGSFYPTSK